MNFVRATQEKETALRSLFEQSYGRLGNIITCSKLERATHANDDALVETTTGIYFVTNNTWGNLFQIPAEQRRPLQEAVFGWSEALRRKGLPTPALVRNDQGQTVTQHNGSIITIEEYVGTRPPTIDRGFQATDSDIQAGAKLLALYHTLAEELKEVPAAQQIRALAGWGPRFSNLRDDYHTITRPKLIDQVYPDGIQKQEDLDTANELFTRVDELDLLIERYNATADQNGVSDGMYINHMDFHPENALWTPSTPHMIDLDGVRPRYNWTSDIAFSATRFGQWTAKKGRNAVDATELFLKTYEQTRGVQVGSDTVIQEAGGIEAAKVFNILNRAYRGESLTYFQNSAARHLPTALAPEKLFAR